MQPLIDGDLSKSCKVCGESKPLSEFHKNKQCSMGVVGTCRTCTGDRISRWYSDNRKRRQEVANEKNRKRKRQLVEHFGDKCLDCGQSFPQCVYQFHHLDPKEKDVNPSYAITQKPSKMWEELSKCVMLCANCHLIRHYGKEAINATTH